MMMIMTLMKLVNSATKFRHGMDKFYQPNSGLGSSRSLHEAIYTHRWISHIVQLYYTYIYIYIIVYIYIIITVIISYTSKLHLPNIHQPFRIVSLSPRLHDSSPKEHLMPWRRGRAHGCNERKGLAAPGTTWTGHPNKRHPGMAMKLLVNGLMTILQWGIILFIIQ